MKTRASLSLDTICFLALVSAHLWLGHIANLIPDEMSSNAFLIPWLWNWFSLPLVQALLAVAIVGYVSADLFGGSHSFRIKSIIGLTTIFFFILAPGLTAIYERRLRGEYLFVHDGAIQIEYAARMLLAGRNPYFENYLDTPLALWPFRVGNLTANPALYHLAYLPFLVLAMAPIDLVARGLVGWVDFRLLLIPLFLTTILLLMQSTRDNRRNLSLAIFAGLNPMFLPYLVEGRTDGFVLFWLVLAIFLLQRNHRLASLLALTVACASKQTAWFIAPFYLVYFLQPRADTTWRATLESAVAKLKSQRRFFAAAIVLFAVIVLPFLLWNAGAFIDGILRYPSGLGDHPYPMNSLGFGGIALALGWAPNSQVRLPFEWLQFVFGLPVLVALLAFQLKKNDISSLWLCYAFLFFVIAFFSNVFNDNHLGYLITLFAMGVLWVDDAG